ncbi:MAG: glycogen/starch synthase [Candidatus Cloacimonetes bacterium]|nr:glycogen/starch synthase [Candidatus Cloacimonadota bacterium]MBS3767133.1 glycogen/starch synthase [Candidatus Cloacimonadota bacterium]
MAKNRKSKTLDQEIEQEYRQVFDKREKPKILLCTPEITELPQGMGNAANIITAKGGGLGDITASLIKYLNDKNEYELHIVLPKYDKSIQKIADLHSQQIDRMAVVLAGRGIHLVNDSAFSYINTPYEHSSIHTPLRRSLVFQRYIINNLLDYLQPDVVHCNDWMTGLIPAAARSKGIKSLFTLHNIFTEKQSLKDIELSGIKPMDFTDWLYFEEYPDLENNWQYHFENNQVDFTASAILASDCFNTVSENFLKELVAGEFPKVVPQSVFEMIKMKYEENRAYGILNAPNDNVNAEFMSDIINFTREDIEEKKPENKKLFQEKMNLPLEPNVPLFFWPSRLYYQKAPDVLVDNMEYFMKKYDMQVAVVASGEKKIEKKLRKLMREYNRVSFIPFVPQLSTLGKAAADFILMPSRYEPSGLPQMEVLRLGTLPVVRATGGLKDSIKPLNLKENTGNGFVFEIPDRTGLEYGIRRAVDFYKKEDDVKYPTLKRVMKEGREKFNMRNTANKYMQIYDKLIAEKTN